MTLFSPSLPFVLLLICLTRHLCGADVITRVRLRGGATPGEGKVEVYREKRRQWGGVCDDGWGMSEADVVCKQLGFKGAKESLTGSYHGAARGLIWIKSVDCDGDEEKIEDCDYLAISVGLKKYQQVDEVNECATTQLAGVVCIEEVAGKDMIELGKPMPEARNSLLVKINLDKEWRPICAKGWTSKESIVACKQAGLKFAQLTVGANVNMLHSDERPEDDVAVSKVECFGTEKTLQDCAVTGVGETECDAYASITCSDFAPDISINMTAFISSLKVDYKPEYKMVCAKSEGCMSASGSKKTEVELQTSKFRRKLLLFSSNVQNFGNADFRPPQVEGGWYWHTCHKHFHSITDFATYELVSLSDGEVVEQGHKVSFCLRDNFCVNPRDKKYRCSTKVADGDQGISVGCADHYTSILDCQWIDITDVPSGTYELVIKSNPYKRVPEQDYSNNHIRCKVKISQREPIKGFESWNCHYPSDFGTNPEFDPKKQ